MGVWKRKTNFRNEGIGTQGGRILSSIIVEALSYFTQGLYSCVIGRSHNPAFCCKSARQFEMEASRAEVQKGCSPGLALLRCVTWG